MGYVKASILVKFYGPTNHKPARYRVSSKTFSYNKKITVNIDNSDYQLSEYQQVYNAALKWIDAVKIVSDITDVVSIDSVTYAVIVG